MKVYVEYRVPVLVEVDLDNEEIVGVCVDDEQVHGPSDVIVVEPGGLPADRSSRAVAIAEADTWPEWELGF
jgi:hypothetical protein